MEPAGKRPRLRSQPRRSTTEGNATLVRAGGRSYIAGTELAVALGERDSHLLADHELVQCDIGRHAIRLAVIERDGVGGYVDAGDHASRELSLERLRHLGRRRL